MVNLLYISLLVLMQASLHQNNAKLTQKLVVSELA